MEFELERIQMNGYDALLDAALRSEETLEMIVPDACPDILRIVETDGTALLMNKSAQDGRVEVSGIIRAEVLYLPEGESGLRHLEVNIPFACAADGQGISAECRVIAAVRLCRADTRAINPRKVLVRVEATADVTVFAPKDQVICVGVADGAAQAEELTETQDIYLTTCVQERPFSISEQVDLPAGKPAVSELLKSRVTLCGGENKIIGSRLVIKGNATVELLYRGEDQGLYTAAIELPFSQILEVMGAAEEAESDIVLALNGWEHRLVEDGEGRTVFLELEAVAQAVVRESRSLTVLVDTYSVSQPLEVERSGCAIDQKVERGVRAQTVREVWETPTVIREVLDCHLSVAQVTQGREGDQLILTAQVELQLLAADAEGEQLGLCRTFQVPRPIELPEGSRCLCRCEPAGNVYTSPTAGGVETRFGLEFRYCAISKRLFSQVSALRPGESTEEPGDRPSLVLRRLAEGERLWDVAKTCGTTIADIISANELETAESAVGKLLLIPRRR